MIRHRRFLSTTVALGAALLALPAAAQAQSAFQATAKAERPPVVRPALPAGAQTLKYRFGPMTIEPGQNIIDIDVQRERPNVNGWIVGFRPGLVRVKDGKSPPVDQVHLHHAVWLVDLKPTFAAGEEKTYFSAPQGYGWRYTTRQSWLLNHMIHELRGSPERVYLTYELDFIPDTAPQAAGMKEIKTQWMDVEGIKPYPVFDALRGQGKKGRFTYPDQARNPYPDGKTRNRWVVDRDTTAVVTAGHLHPGGLHTDLWVERGGRKVNIFKSRAIYFEPAGAVSWDVAMTATPSNWRVALKKGDVVTTTATYDTSRASWYEVMGIMVLGLADEGTGGVDPFSGKVVKNDVLTHGRLKENIDSGGRPNPGLTNPLRLRDGPRVTTVRIRNFVYGQGDLSMRGRKGRPPVVRPGQTLRFLNEDEPLTVRFHTITACKAPCNRTGGIRYPLANGPRVFDSGELGFGPATDTAALYPGGDAQVPFTAAVNVPAPAERCRGVKGIVGALSRGCVGSAEWRTPKNLRPGTYTYFCRVHPFMRGAFRVKSSKSRR